jgi:predicted amidohydrolase
MIHLSNRQIHAPVIRVLFSSISLAWISSCRAMSTSTTAASASPPPALVSRIAVAQLCSTSNKYQNLLNIAMCAGQARQEKAIMLFLPENCGFMGSESLETLANAEPPMIINSGKKTEIAASSKNSAFVSQALMERVKAFAEGNGNSIEEKETTTSCCLDNVSLLDGLSNIARASNMWISVGGIHERGAPPSIVENEEEEESSSSSSSLQKPRTYNTHVILDNEGEIRAVYRKIHLFDVSIPGKVNLQESASTAPGDKIIICDSPIGMYKVLYNCWDFFYPKKHVAFDPKID